MEQKHIENFNAQLHNALRGLVYSFQENEIDPRPMQKILQAQSTLAQEFFNESQALRKELELLKTKIRDLEERQ